MSFTVLKSKKALYLNMNNIINNNISTINFIYKYYTYYDIC